MLRQMLFLFVFILIGLLLGKTGKIDPDHTGVISTLLVYVCTPFVNFRTFARNFTPAYIRRGYLYLIAAAVVIGVLHVFGGWLSRKLTDDPYERKVWQYSLVVPNFGFMGYPVVGGALGEEALMDFMMFCLPFSLYVYAYSLPVLTRAKPSLRGLLNPPMLAIFGGMAVGLSGLPLPEAVTELIGPAADVLGCFGMILLGAVLSGFSLKDMLGDRNLYLITALRLVGIPLAVGVPAMLLLPPEMGMIILIFCSLACGLNTVVFPKLVGENCLPGAGIALVSSTAACVTIPLLTKLAERFFF